MDIQQKLKILAASARYDVSCASSGSKRRAATKGGLGSAASCGICHSFTPDGRCVSLLKILLSNNCIYDCRYCFNRRSNDISRAEFTALEVAQLTTDFYRRNYIEGLFLSSAIVRNVDYTMEQLVHCVRLLRTQFHFNGYVHLKVMPGASQELFAQAGRWADRLSANIELPTQKDLDLIAPQKSQKLIEGAMNSIGQKLSESRYERKKTSSAPVFAPAGQSTQMIVGATASSDWLMLNKAVHLYQQHQLKRVYYSAFKPVVEEDPVLPSVGAPLMREHRLYEADWLYRYYGFEIDELFTPTSPNLDLEIDPKLSWALSRRELFPVDINSAAYEVLLRVPGLGQRSVKRILAARKQRQLSLEDLKRMRIPLSRAKFFVLTADKNTAVRFLDDQRLRRFVSGGPKQLSLFSSIPSAISGEL